MRISRFIFIVALIVAGVLTLKIAVHFLGFEFIQLHPMFSAVTGGVIFIIGILFGGTLPDYKESEKIPGEISVSVKSIYKDMKLSVTDKKMFASMHQHLKDLVGAMIDNFKNNRWKQREINAVLDAIDEDIMKLSMRGVQIGFIARMRNEITNLERFSNRIETIKETSFMPAANTIAKVVVTIVIGMLIFTTIEPFYVTLFILAAVSFLLIGLLMLIKDIDDPFEPGDRSVADVDLKLIYKLEDYLKNHDNK
ncbi:MAG: hypothetical protein J4473_01920 [Candidatus Aenigmarchaeota archaeon]|nr:hypothetical protein [Candidatus Aenigmarchaeota archaeon]